MMNLILLSYINSCKSFIMNLISPLPPLSICRLGSSHGKEFVRSFAHVILGENWKQAPALRELIYIYYIKIDLENNNQNDFGLVQALKDQAFYIEFSQFSQSNEEQLHDYLNG